MIKNFFNLDTKIILRISGLPRLNFFRKIFWNYSEKRIFFATSPTIETKNRLIKLKIFKKNKIHLLRDPILETKDLKNKNYREYKKRNKFLAIGRLTKQKNFTFLVDCFEKILIRNRHDTLTIAGEGEERKTLQALIKKKNLEKNIKLVGYQKNVKKFYKSHDCFILTSLWEDPGFVLVEAASNFIPIISSDCKSGPKEISSRGKNFFLFQTNNKNDFLKKIDKFKKIKTFDLRKKCIASNKFANKYSTDSHSKILLKLLNNYSYEKN